MCLYRGCNMATTLKELNISTMGSLVNNTTEKKSLVDFDMFPVMDSKDNNLVKKYSFKQLTVQVGDQMIALLGDYYDKTEIDSFGYLPSASYTATDVLTKIKTVDGSTSGLDADLLDGEHASAFSLVGHVHSEYMATSGGYFTGTFYGKSSTGVIAVGTQGDPSFEVRGDSSNSAYINFHRTSAYAVRFGLDTDNKLKIGGFSMGAVAYEILNQNNVGTYASLIGHTHANLTAGNGISGSTYTGANAYTWSVVGDTGITATSTGVAITAITAGDSTTGALRYSGTGANNGQMNGGTNITTSTIRLNYNGIFYAVGLRFGASGSSSYSDERLKKYIKDIENATDLIYSLKPRMYKLRAKLGGINEYHYGLIAQEVVKVLEETGIEKTAFLQYPREEDEYFGIDYTQLIAPLIATVQELNTRLKALEKGNESWN